MSEALWREVPRSSEGEEATARAYEVQSMETSAPSFVAPSFKKIGFQVLSSRRWQWRLLTLFDFLIAGSSMTAAFLLSPSSSGLFSSAQQPGIEILAPLFACIFVVASLASGTYDMNLCHDRISLFLRCSVAATLAWASLLLVNLFATYLPVGRYIVVLSIFSTAVFSYGVRALWQRASGCARNRVLLIGPDELAGTLNSASASQKACQLEIVGTLPPVSASRITNGAKSPHLLQLCRALEADVIVVQEGTDVNTMNQALECVQHGVSLRTFPEYFEEVFQRVPTKNISHHWIATADMWNTRPLEFLLKRWLDIVISVTVLVLTLPAWPLIMLAIKSTSKGPVFFVQKRVGLGGAIFRLIKFRTMIVNAEPEGKPLWATRNDPRITWVGRILRRTRLDELPQLWNVLRGEMSFVGPRPERPEFVSRLTARIPAYRLRHMVKPGLTGWAQINFRYAASEGDSLSKLDYDLYYVRHGCLLLDLAIIIRTIGVLMRGSR